MPNSSAKGINKKAASSCWRLCGYGRLCMSWTYLAYPFEYCAGFRSCTDVNVHPLGLRIALPKGRVQYECRYGPNVVVDKSTLGSCVLFSVRPKEYGCIGLEQSVCLLEITVLREPHQVCLYSAVFKRFQQSLRNATPYDQYLLHVSSAYIFSKQQILV